MQTLFAPWRLEYVTTADTHAEGDCIFCQALTSRDDRTTLTLWRWPRCFALLNRFPYTSGHAMVAPARHVGNLDELDSATLGEIMVAAKSVVQALRQVYDPHAFNLGFNLGEAAGAGIAEHLHLHVIPRWRGDTSFVSIVGGTRVIPEDLDRTHSKLTAALGEILEG